MQFKAKEYDARYLERWRALTIDQPLALELCKPILWSGEWKAVADSIQMRFGTDYRGDILIVSGKKYLGDTYFSSEMTIGIVELYDVERSSSGAYIWKFRNPRRVVEFPASGPKGKLWWYVCPKGEVTEYPRHIQLG